MALKMVLDSIDDLPKEVQEHYTKGADGKFYLAAEGIEEHPDVQGLKAKKEELLTAQKKLKEKLKVWDGMDADEVAAAMAAAEKAKEEGLIDKGDLTALKTDYEAKLTKLKKEEAAKTEMAQEETKAERKAARDYFRQSEIRRAVAAAAGSVELLEPAIVGMTKVERTDGGAYILQVLDATGSPRIKDSAGNPFNVDDLLGEMKGSDVYGRAFDASGQTGSGATGTGGKGGTGTTGAKVKIKASDMGKGDNLAKVASGEIEVVPD